MPTPILDGDGNVIGERLRPFSLDESAYATDGWVDDINGILRSDSQVVSHVTPTFAGTPEDIAEENDSGTAFARAHSAYSGTTLLSVSHPGVAIEKTTREIETLHSVTMRVRTMANNTHATSPPTLIYQLHEWEPGVELLLSSTSGGPTGYFERNGFATLMGFLGMPDPVDNSTYEFDFPHVPAPWAEGDPEYADYMAGVWAESLDGTQDERPAHLMCLLFSRSGAGPSAPNITGEGFVYELWLDVVYDSPDEEFTPAPPLRQFPRDDGLGPGSVRRMFPPPRSVQRGIRRAGGYL